MRDLTTPSMRHLKEAEYQNEEINWCWQNFISIGPPIPSNWTVSVEGSVSENMVYGGPGAQEGDVGN